jgi:nucleotide-binding universal stress UspA family protein
MDDSPVIAGTDGSEASMRAVEWAAREAAARRRDLYIFAVPAMPRGWQPGRPDAVAEHLCAVADLALATAAARAAELEPDLCVCTERLSGPPAQALLGAAAGGSMLVVGSRGAGGFEALLLGSLSRHVAFAAPCPVVVARQETAVVHRQVVVGVGRADRPAALGFAFDEARLHRARLQVVHAWELFLPPALLTGAGRPGAAGGGITEEATAWLGAQLAPWREKYPDIRVVVDVVNASPGRALAAASAQADLVVLGRRGQQDPSAGGTGAVIHAVLNHGRCPVAVVPD